MFDALFVPADDDPRGNDWTDEIVGNVDYRTAYRAVLEHAKETCVELTARYRDFLMSDTERWFVCDGGHNGAYLITAAQSNAPAHPVAQP